MTHGTFITVNLHAFDSTSKKMEIYFFLILPVILIAFAVPFCIAF